jgi:hypothetical protein
MSFREVNALLERNGIESFTLGSSLLAESVYVVGKDTAFRARQVIRANAEIEKLNVGWRADVLVHTPDSEIHRVAEVGVASGSTGSVVELLEGRFWFLAVR